jgi:hypothetical protein
VVLNVDWPLAAEHGRLLVDEAVRRGLSVFLPFGPPPYGPMLAGAGSEAPGAAYWQELVVWEGLFNPTDFPEDAGWEPR